MKDIKEIGKIFKEHREKKKLSIEDVYKKTLIHPGLLRDIEAGKADEALDKIYVKSFLKKYAAFLGIDIGSELEERYKKLELAAEEPKGNLYARKEAITLKSNNYVSLILSVIVAVIFIFFVFTGISKIKSFLKHHATRKTTVLSAKKAVPPVKAKKEPAAKETEPAQAAPAPLINLSIKSAEAVWVRVKKDGETVFNGTLSKGSRESWSGKKGFELRVGKLEALDITLNSKNLGKVGSGTKNITVDKDGVHIVKSP